ncbi:hypothetical protein FKM82_019890 [Ascaphus truei]
MLSEDIGNVGAEMARLGETNSSSSQGNSSSSTEGTQDAQMQRKIVVVGDSIIRKVDRAICCRDRMNRTVCCLPGARFGTLRIG